MEELLNKLIERGRKPFGHYDRMYLSDKSSYQYHKVEGIRSYFFVKGNGVGDNFTLRELVSKESGLWQFACEHGIIKTYMNIEHESRRHSDKKHTPVGAFDNQSYYYIIESALKDESELEQFLLDNIKL